MKLKSMFLKVAMLTFIAARLMSCAGKPADEPGLCKLACSKAVIASTKYKIESLMGDVTVRCLTGSAGQSFSVPLKFRVVKEDPRDGDFNLPVPYVSVNPVVIGSADSRFGSGSYKGISTSDSDFCSDSCGAVSLTVNGICPDQEDSALSVAVFSGALKGDVAKITIAAPQEDTGD